MLLPQPAKASSERYGETALTGMTFQRALVSLNWALNLSVLGYLLVKVPFWEPTYSWMAERGLLLAGGLVDVRLATAFSTSYSNWGTKMDANVGEERAHLFWLAEFPSKLQKQLQMGRVGFMLCLIPFLFGCLTASLKSPSRSNNCTSGVCTAKCIAVCKGLLCTCYTRTCVSVALFLKTISQCFSFHAFKCKCWKFREH